MVHTWYVDIRDRLAAYVESRVAKVCLPKVMLIHHDFHSMQGDNDDLFDTDSPLSQHEKALHIQGVCS